MAELLVGLVDMLGIYVLYSLGKLSINIFTFGTYSSAPYLLSDKQPSDKPNRSDTNIDKQVSKQATMGIGFVLLIVITLAIAVSAQQFIST